MHQLLFNIKCKYLLEVNKIFHNLKIHFQVTSGLRDWQSFDSESSPSTFPPKHKNQQGKQNHTGITKRPKKEKPNKML